MPYGPRSALLCCKLNNKILLSLPDQSCFVLWDFLEPSLKLSSDSHFSPQTCKMLLICSTLHTLSQPLQNWNLMCFMWVLVPDAKVIRWFEFMLINQVFLNVTIAFLIKPAIDPSVAVSNVISFFYDNFLFSGLGLKLPKFYEVCGKFPLWLKSTF